MNKDEYIQKIEIIRSKISASTGPGSGNSFDHTALVRNLVIDKYGKCSIFIEESPLKDRGVDIVVRLPLDMLRNLVEVALDKRLNSSKVIE